MKKIIYLILTLTFISFVVAYTAPSYNDIDLVLEGDYSAPSYTSIDLVLGEPSDTCTCPGLETNWEISLADYCNITSNCNISTGNITFINNGTVMFNATLTANSLTLKDEVGATEKYNLEDNFRGLIG